jgi:hypothetical protein
MLETVKCVLYHRQTGAITQQQTLLHELVQVMVSEAANPSICTKY